MPQQAAVPSADELALEFSAVIQRFPELKKTPDAERNEILSSAVCRFAEANMTKPPWGHRWRLTPNDEAKGGVGAAIYAAIPGTDDFVVILVQPNKEDGKTKLQTPGGFVEFHRRESLLQAVSREIGEELVLPVSKRKLFEGDLTERLTPMDDKFFYVGEQATYVNGFAMEMTLEELYKATELQQILASEGMRAAFTEATEGELYNMQVISLKYLIQNPELLYYPDQWTLFRNLGLQLEKEGRFVMPDLNRSGQAIPLKNP